MKLDKQKNFRLRAIESAWVEKAAARARLTESDWLRLVVLTALGKTALLEHLTLAAQTGRGAIEHGAAVERPGAKRVRKARKRLAR